MSQFRVPAPISSSSGSVLSKGSLPPEFLLEASRRLGWASLIYAATFFVAYFGSMFYATATGVITDLTLLDILSTRWVQTLVAVLSIVMALLVFVLCRFVTVQPALLLDIGLIFEVVGSFGISMAQFWSAFPAGRNLTVGQFLGIPWECVWILVFPLLAPSTPGKTLLAAFGAASTGLLTILISKVSGATAAEPSMLFFVGYFLTTTYVCAVVAFLISRGIYRYGHRLKRAQEVGSYQLTEKIGQGGMGEVWLGRHRLLARPAAVKLIRAERLGLDEHSARILLKRFEREAQATALLRSCHTVEVYDFGITPEKTFYYVMELLEGFSLDQLVKQFGPLPAARTVHLLLQVCHSLGEAHQAGLIHRDIKPANIFTCRLGPDFDFVKVLDFGLVKQHSAVGEGTELTVEGATAGTPAFLAPELAMSRAEVDGRADLYAVGCVAYWLLTARTVFTDESPMAVALSHVQTPPVPPSQVTNMPIPPDLEKIVLRCLEKDPARRPADANELARDLANVRLAQSWTAELASRWWKHHPPPTISAEPMRISLEGP